MRLRTGIGGEQLGLERSCGAGATETELGALGGVADFCPRCCYAERGRGCLGCMFEDVVKALLATGFVRTRAGPGSV